LERIGLQLGKGLGIQTQTPAMAKSPAFEADARITAILKDLRLSPRLASQQEEDRFKMLSSGQ